jgi:hypothetical protein
MSSIKARQPVLVIHPVLSKEFGREHKINKLQMVAELIIERHKSPPLRVRKVIV